MEFDTTARDSSQGVSDADRLAASTKRLTIAPIHEVTTEEPVIRPREDIDPSIPMTEPNVYIASESEDTSTLQATATSEETITSVAGLPTRPLNRTTLFIVVGLFVAITGGIVIYLLA